MHHTLAVFVSSKRADLAGAAGQHIVAAAARIQNTDVTATQEQGDLATTLRAKANRLFETGIARWAKLPPATPARK